MLNVLRREVDLALQGMDASLSACTLAWHNTCMYRPFETGSQPILQGPKPYWLDQAICLVLPGVP